MSTRKERWCYILWYEDDSHREIDYGEASDLFRAGKNIWIVARLRTTDSGHNS
jgi:hypothetical protein